MQHVERPPGHLGAEVGALGVGLLGQAQDVAPLVGGEVVLRAGRSSPAGRSRPTGGASRPPPAPGRRGPRPSRRPGRARTRRVPSVGEHPADAEQLVLGGEGAGHRLAVDGPVHDRARGREAERPGLRCPPARARPWPRCRRGWPARCARPAHPSRRRGPRRGAPACRRRRCGACARGRRGTRGRSPSPR